MNVIARLEYELAYYDSAVHHFNHYTTRTPHPSLVKDYFFIFDFVLFAIMVKQCINPNLGNWEATASLVSLLFWTVILIQFLVCNAGQQEPPKNPVALSLCVSSVCSTFDTSRYLKLSLSISTIVHLGTWSKPWVSEERKRRKE